MKATDFLIPLVLALVLLWGAVKKVPVFDTFVKGAKEGCGTAFSILPALIILMTAVAMFKASGALEFLIRLFSPLLETVGIPGEILPLALLRPVSGSGALAVGTDLMTTYGPDSYVGRVAAVMLGSTETTFYTIAVYFGSAGIHRTRHAMPAALLADMTGFAASAFAVRLFFGT